VKRKLMDLLRDLAYVAAFLFELAMLMLEQAAVALMIAAVIYYLIGLHPNAL
jgi:hypothetical protein